MNRDLGDTSHLNCTYVADRTTVICGGCGLLFPVVKTHDDDWESPEWERHARAMQDQGRKGGAS